jgi:hypothetical protein
MLFSSIISSIMHNCDRCFSELFADIKMSVPEPIPNPEIKFTKVKVGFTSFSSENVIVEWIEKCARHGIGTFIELQL